MNKEKVLKTITQRYNDEKRIVVPFIGAGISKVVEDKDEKNILPDWDEFCKKLLGSIKQKDKYVDLKNDPQEVAEYYIYKKAEIDDLNHERSALSKATDGKSELISFIKNNLSVNVTRNTENKYFINGKESEKLGIHFALKDKFKFLYTTNWDNLLEGITEYEPIYLTSQLVKPNVRERKKVIFKFHGDINTDASEKGNPLICCKSDYFDRISNENPFDILFKNDLLHSDFLFVGYSFRDPNIYLVVSEINELISQGIIDDKDNHHRSTIYWLITDYKDDPRLKVMYNSNIKPIDLLRESDKTELKKEEDKLKKLCFECKVDLEKSSPKVFCNNCEKEGKMKEMKNKFKKKRNKISYDRLKEFINELPKFC